MLRRFMPGDWIAIAALALAGIVWAVRLEGRQDAQQRDLVATAARVDAVRSDQERNYERLLAELHYVRMRLDEALASRRQ